MLKYTAFKLSVNTMHPTLTQALIALRRGMCRTLTTDLLSLIVPVPKVPEQGAGSKTYEYLMTYVRNLNEMGKS